MDEKIEEMAKVYDEATNYARNYLGSLNNAGKWYGNAFYNAGYRKESDTAREILTLIKNGVELNSMIDGDAKIAIMNELRWAGQKYGVDLWE